MEYLKASNLRVPALNQGALWAASSYRNYFCP